MALCAASASSNAPSERIGIVLPPGKGGVVANLAVVLAGKMPVNLNFTSARDVDRIGASAQAELKTIITARAVREAARGFSLDAQT